MQVLCADCAPFIFEVEDSNGCKYSKFMVRVASLSNDSYSTISQSTTNVECIERLFEIARSEDRTLHLIMMILKGRDSKWYEKASYDDYNAKEMINNSFPIGDIEKEVRNNYVFQTLLDERIDKMAFEEILTKCKPLFDYVAENYVTLSDVYDKDLDNLAGMSTKQKILIAVNSNNEYLGHIYHYYTQTRKHRVFGSNQKYYYTNEAVMIGIRSSLLNIGRKLMGQSHTTHISYTLLDAATKVMKMLHNEIDVVNLENPIGGMSDIAIKFGFNKDYNFRIREDGKKVDVKPYKLSFFI